MYWEHIGWKWISIYFLVGEIGHKSHIRLGDEDLPLPELQNPVV